MKSETTIRREIAKLKTLDKDELNPDGTRIQAGAMVLALEWVLGQWGMNWSKWLNTCAQSARKRTARET